MKTATLNVTAHRLQHPRQAVSMTERTKSTRRPEPGAARKRREELARLEVENTTLRRRLAAFEGDEESGLLNQNVCELTQASRWNAHREGLTKAARAASTNALSRSQRQAVSGIRTCAAFSRSCRAGSVADVVFAIILYPFLSASRLARLWQAAKRLKNACCRRYS